MFAAASSVRDHFVAQTTYEKIRRRRPVQSVFRYLTLISPYQVIPPSQTITPYLFATREAAAFALANTAERSTLPV